MGAGASNYAGVTMANCAERKRVFTTPSGTTMRGGGITSGRLSAAGWCVKNSLRELIGLLPTGIHGVSANLMRASVMVLEAAQCLENVVNHALHSAVTGSRATLYISRFLQASLGPDSLCVLQSDSSVQTNMGALILSDTSRTFVCECTGFLAAQLENESLSLSMDCSGLAGALEHIRLTAVRRLPSDPTDIVLNSPLSMHLVDALMARYVP